MTSELWPDEHDDDPNAFLRDSLGPVFEERNAGSAIVDRYGCTRWISFLCFYTHLPHAGISTLDLLRAHDPDEFASVRAAALGELGVRASGVVAVPDKLSRTEWEARYSPESADGQRRSRLADAVRTRGLALDEEVVGLKGSRVVWEEDGITESAILKAMGLTVEDARRIVATYNRRRLPDPFWRDKHAARI